MVDVKTYSCFPTQIHEFSLKFDEYTMTNMIYYIENGNTGNSLHQTEDDIHKISYFSNFKNSILEVNKNILDGLEYEYDKLIITNMWGNKLNVGATHPPHTHSNNFLSGVFYLQSDNKSAPIQFFDPRAQANILIPRRKNNNWNNSTVIQFDSVAGIGFIFPSWLQHWVGVNEGTRMSVSWNILIEGHYGEPKTLQNAYIKEK